MTGDFLLLMAKKEKDPEYTLNFEYEYVEDGRFVLYERGGDRYLCGHGQCAEPQPEGSLKNIKLNILYPIAISKKPYHDPIMDLTDAMRKIILVKCWSFPGEFIFNAKKLGEDPLPFKGTASVSYDGRQGKLEKLSIH